MMLYLGPGESVRGPAGLGVVHVTLHMALRDCLRVVESANRSSRKFISSIDIVSGAAKVSWT